MLEKETDVEKVIGYAKSTNIDIAFIGPEAPLAAGISDALWEAGISVIGPKKTAQLSSLIRLGHEIS